MNQIVAPLRPQMQGASVADLQDGLQQLLERGAVLADDPAGRTEAAAGLRDERARQAYGDRTAKLVATFQKAHGLEPSGQVDERTAAALNDLLAHLPPPDFQGLVRGQVLWRGGLPIAGVLARAFHRDLRKEVLIGTATTDANGNFEIYYDPARVAAQSGLLGDRPPDVFVRISQPGGIAAGPVAPEKVLAESPIRFAAQKVLKFRLTVDGGPSKTWSEFDQLGQEMKPFLSGLAIQELVEDDKNQDVTLLSGKLAQDPARVAAFVAAHKLAAEVAGDPAVFYALLRKGLPSNLPDLLAVPAPTRSRALVSAIRDGLAPGRLVGQVRAVRKRFTDEAATFAAADKTVAGRARLGAVLRTGIADAGVVEGLVQRMTAHVGPPQALWKAIAADPKLAPAVPDAQLTLQLAALTGRHVPMVKALLQRRKNGTFGKLGGLQELAGYGEAEWLALIQGPELPDAERVPPSIPGKDAAEKARVYAATLARIVADAMPTQVFARKAQAAAAEPADVKTFFRNVAAHPEFELGRGRVGAALEKAPALLEGVADRQALVARLEQTQRLFNLTHSYDEQQALRSAGLGSSLSIARLGQGAFVQRMAGTAVAPQQAVLLYEKASRVSAAALDFVTQFSPSFNLNTPFAIAAPAVKGVPDLETLFGSLDLCACEDCRSIHGPAAYLADLLAYLADRASTTPKVSALDVLLRRRPDLGEVELSCANTNTVLPYTDLVNELLERRIAPFPPFDLPGAAEGELNARTISDGTRAAFAAQKLALAPEARVVVGTPSARWSITDGSTLFSVVKTGGAIHVTGAWPQTGASAAALAAVPEHLDPAAYELLGDEVFPWELPLELPTEETRLFLAHLGAPRHELMAELRAGGPSAALDDVGCAAELLGLGDAARQHVTATVAAPHKARQPWEYWGLQQNGNVVRVWDAAAKAPADKPLAWLDALAWVREVLKRSGLDYDTLVRILGGTFVNPGGKVRIVSADPDDLATCDTAKLTLTNLTAAVADALTRFVRLWRTVGGEPEELDRVLVAVCGSTLGDAAVVTLSHVRRLQLALGRGVDELVSLWSPIPTTGADPLYRRLFLNPDVLTPVDPAFTLGPGPELAIVAGDPANAKIARHAAPILAALRISAADLAALQAGGVAADDALTLANLSALYRHALLAQALDLTIPDLLLLRALAGIDPFAAAATADTVRFVDLAAKVAASGLGISDLGYLLFHLAPDTAPLAPPLGAAADVLADLRRRLAALRSETTARPDPAGDALRRELATLRWPAGVSSDAIAALGGTARYTTALDPAPPGFAVPADFAARLTWDAGSKTLSLTGSLTTTERDTLQAAFPAANYKAAIADLYGQPRAFARTRLRAYEWPRVAVPLAALPAGLTLPPALAARVAWDPAAKRLSFDGAMTAADKAALDALSTDGAWRTATAALLAAADAFAPPADDTFVTAAIADALFDQPVPADRFAAVLAMVLARRRIADGTRLVVRSLADAAGLSYRLSERLLTVELPDPAAPAERAVQAFLDDAFAASDPGTPPTEALFPAPFEIVLRLMKIAALVRQMKLSDRAVGWLGDLGAAVPARKVVWGGGVLQSKWLSLVDLPAKTEAIDPARFAAWLRLADLGALGAGLPGGEATAEAVFVEARAPGASAASVTKRLAAVTGWDEAELGALSGALGLALPQDLLDEVGLARLRDATRRLRRLGTTVVQAQAWAVPAPTADAGVAARRAVQGAYAPDQWPDAIRPLEEKLREERRAALVTYLVPRADAAKGETWTDTNGMYAHLLIDVETHPVVLTSRLKQAIGSVQLFVQRCLMNLEPDVVADDAKDVGWRQWSWMKQFRVWEANRKIFLYPENYTQPALRDDKSPFFQELEGTLLQSDVTAETAEAAYVAYLARLDEVARLEIAGMFLQPGEGGAPDELHVFARTNADPPAYFYRKWVGQARWTPWERLDLDIPAGPILPIVWNRRLYLFWPIFTSKTTPPPEGGDKPASGTPYLELQLAWSERFQDRWSPKSITPAEVTLKSVIAVDGSTSDAQARKKHVFRATTNGPQLWIWYESSDTRAPQVDKYGNLVRPGGAIATQGWLFTGCNGRVSIFAPYNVGVFPPPNTHASGMTYEEDSGADGSLQLPRNVTGTDAGVVLSRTPGAEPFRLLSPHQEQYLSGRMPFFFQDDSETLFVVPREEIEWVKIWTIPERVTPALVDVLDHLYFQPDPIPDPIGPVSDRWDPVPVIRAQAAAKLQGAAIAGPAAAAALAAFHLPAPPVALSATAPVEHAFQARKAQVQAIRGTKAKEIVALGERQLIPISKYLDPGRLFTPGIIAGVAVTVRRYEFHTHYHPWVCPMIRALNVSGVDALLQRATQLQTSAPFEGRYGPTSLVEMGDPAKKDRYPVEDVDFRFDGAYACYNWELFFHVPLLIASKLAQNQQFEDAQRWLHAIFDPTDVSGGDVPARYWRTRPFFEQKDYLQQRIDKLLEALAKGVPDEELSRQVSEWLANPFRPFAVARVRTVAFQKNVVMTYLDNLIAWGDQLFRRDTIEALNEATQLYVLAAEILGPRPAAIPPRAVPETHTFDTLAPKFSALTDALTDIEVVIGSPRVDAVLSSPDAPPLPVPQLLYFCVPPNDQLLAYWDTVADRLLKIRNSLNLAGIRRTLPLFEPPIDPMLLVKAAAAGVDLSTAIADVAAPAPLYRFSFLAQTASELVEDVRGLGAALLAALERRDAEELARIQADHEVAVLKRVTAVKEAQIQEATAQIAALQAARELANERYRHYMTLLGAQVQIPKEGVAAADAPVIQGAATQEDSGARLIPQESTELSEMADAADSETTASDWDAAANFSYYIPEFHVAAEPWGIGVEIDFGGRHVGPALTAIANLYRSDAADHRHKAQKAARLAEFILRAHNWSLEANLAAREMARVDGEIAVARVRETLAKTDRDNHLKQIDEAGDVAEYLRTKYTNRELYDWMVGQLSGAYFQAYQLAYDTARKAERAFRRELAVADTDFIRFGYWDSLRKGLLAADGLMHDLRRMQVAYLDQNAREFEITKHVSLADLHPEGLLALQEQGACFVDLPEAIFDLDHPGHYLRRIRAVSVTVPCVTGPYTSVPCKLTLLASRTRVDPKPTPQYAMTGPEDRRFELDTGGLRAVVTSSGREDPGLFEQNLRDERYLPFEGAGAISSWRLELPADFRPFDYRTISDVILHVRYTARDGGEPLRTAATKKLVEALRAMEVEDGRTGTARGFSAKDEFPDAWRALSQMPDGQPGVPLLALPITADRLPAFTRGRTAKITRVLAALVPAPGVAYDDGDRVTLTLTPPGGAGQPLTLASVPARAGGLPMAEVALAAPVAVADPRPGDPTPPPWKLEFTHLSANLARNVLVNGANVARLDPEKVSDVVLLCGYTI